MFIPRVYLAAVVLAGSIACNATEVAITPPRVPEGGRAKSIAVRSNNNKRIVVASDSGGLFQTFNGGVSWLHIDAFPNFAANDVASAWLAPDVLIVTAQSKYRKVNDGGIWRGKNDGTSWTQPATATPPPGLLCTDRISAYGISHMPLSRTFYVGTDCGLAVSRDDGATWTHSVVDASASSKRIDAVQVISRTSGVAAGSSGMYFLNANGAWNRSPDDLNSGRRPAIHSLAAPWWLGSDIYFHASVDHELFISTDAGASWTKMQVPTPQYINGREAFVRVARSVTNDDSKFDIYFGDSVDLYRKTVSNSSPATSGSWKTLSLDHPDPSDIAFDTEQRMPLLLASDGGVHLTTDKGASWKLTGGGFGGFSALQITEVTGQEVTGSKPHLDLYYVTQDNYVRASSDGGQTWNFKICGEGRYFRTPPTSVDHKDAVVTGIGIGCKASQVLPVNLRTEPHLVNKDFWDDAPNSAINVGAQAPFPILTDVYLQGVTDVFMTSLTYDYFLSLSTGSAWSKSFTLNLKPVGIPVFAGFLANPTVYQGVERQGNLPNGGLRFGLMRAGNLAGQSVVTEADKGIFGLGSLRTPIARYVVFGADPKNANHLIAPDVSTNGMKFSVDGGANWFPYPQLTKAVTDNGAYLFTIGEHSLASVIAWDPYDSCHILVGTLQNGILRSTDGGSSWSQVKGSKVITRVTSFYFPSQGPIWVSTDGRSLWNLNLNRKNVSSKCRFPTPPTGTGGGGGGVGGGVILSTVSGSQQPFKGLDDPAICPQCSLVVVQNGWIVDLERSDNNIRKIAISGGTISQIDKAGREIPLAIPNVYQTDKNQILGRLKLKRPVSDRKIRGLVLEGSQLRYLLLAADDLPFAPQRTPKVLALSILDANAIDRSKEIIRVAGWGFLPTLQLDQAVRILFDDRVVAEGIVVSPDGSFSVQLPSPQFRGGDLIITVEQRDGQRITRERTHFEMLLSDREEPIRK